MNIGAPGEFNSERVTFTVGEGQQRELTFEGTQQYIRALYAGFVANGYNATCDIKAGLCTLTIKNISLGADEETAHGVEIEMQINRVHKSIFEPPGPSGLFFSSEDLAIIKRALASDGLAEDVLDVVALGSDAEALYDLALAGVEHRLVWQPVITQVTTGGRLHQFPAGAHNGVGDNYSQAAMLSELNAFPQFALPFFGSALPSGFSYGWVKQMPHYTQVVGQRVSETVSFEFGAWANLLYPLYG